MKGFALLAVLPAIADSFRLVKHVKVVEAELENGPNISIVNGDDAKECRWKHQVGLKSSASGRPWCGGTLISAEWVLTAAHCLEDEAQRGVYVVAGEWNTRSRSGNEQTKRSRSFAMHPRYNPSTTNYDFALLRVESPFTMNSCVGTARLPSSDVPSGTACWITGWGTVKEDGSSATILQEGQVQTMSNTQCQNTGYAARQITSNMLCAQGKTRSGAIVDACQGDSGGPLVCGSSTSWTVYGATSWGRGCARANYPGVWARVFHEISWIRSTMR